MLEDEHLAASISDICASHYAFRPPQATSVSKGASRSLFIKQPGAAGGLWNPEETPYMVEPMDRLSSRLHEAVCFVGPARTGKTAGMLLGWMTHAVVNDPGDMLFIQMTQDKAREFSKTDVNRAVDNSADIRRMLSHNASDRNTHDIMFKHGMWLRIAWPTVSNVSGSTYRYVAITDLDRIPNAENVDGEGPLFSLALKRTTTFMSRGMCLAESSPGINLTDPGWRPATPHEAPPVTGVLGIYNRSDRNRWYWECPDCRDRFEAAPGLGLFGLPEDRVLVEEVRTANLVSMAKHYGARVICPHCGSLIERRWKLDLNKTGIWLPDSAGHAMQSAVSDEMKELQELEGAAPSDEPQANIAGYWLGGVAAAYQKWESLVLRHLQGLRDYALTGSEETLKTTVNTDQGMPYMPRHLVEARAAITTPEERAVDLPRYVVPDWTRCAVASVDVQGGSNARFVVQVHAVGPFMEQQLVDRFEIRDSMRPGMVEGEFAPIDPAGYPEDWDVLTEKLLRATWKTPIAGREIKLRKIIVDTGGEDGVTDNAYAWYRRLRKIALAGRVVLYKGGTEPKAPMIRPTRWGKRKEGDKGDIPGLLCNPHLLSDAVDAGLRRQTPGPGYIHFPRPKHPTRNPNGWLPQAFFDELGAEVRNAKGIWSKVRKRNESFDLCRMIRALLLHMGLDKIKDWSKVPAWLAPLDMNSEVITVEDRREMKANTAVPAEEVISDQPKVRVVPTRPAKRPRRAIASPYLR